MKNGLGYLPGPFLRPAEAPSTLLRVGLMEQLLKQPGYAPRRQSRPPETCPAGRPGSKELEHCLLALACH
jgi:hypothetical protein